MEINDRELQQLYDFVCTAHGQIGDHVWGKMRRDDAVMIQQVDGYFTTLRRRLYILTQSRPVESLLEQGLKDAAEGRVSEVKLKDL